MTIILFYLINVYQGVLTLAALGLAMIYYLPQISTYTLQYFIHYTPNREIVKLWKLDSSQLYTNTYISYEQII